MKKLFTTIACFALALVSLFTIVGCDNTQTGKYNVSFGGDIVYNGDAHTVTTARWEKSEEEKTGSYNILNKDTDNKKVKHQSFSSGDSESKKTTYFFYRQEDDTVRTLTMHLGFDGTAENDAVHKFVINSANYTLATNA